MPYPKQSYLDGLVETGIANYRKTMEKWMQERGTVNSEELALEHAKSRAFILEKSDKQIDQERGRRTGKQWKKQDRQKLIEAIEAHHKSCCGLNELRQQMTKERENYNQIKTLVDLLIAEMVKAKWEMQKESKIMALQGQINVNMEAAEKVAVRMEDIKREMAQIRQTEKAFASTSLPNGHHHSDNSPHPPSLLQHSSSRHLSKHHFPMASFLMPILRRLRRRS